MSVLSFSNICGFSKAEAGCDGKALDVRYGFRGAYLQRSAHGEYKIPCKSGRHRGVLNVFGR